MKRGLQIRCGGVRERERSRLRPENLGDGMAVYWAGDALRMWPLSPSKIHAHRKDYKVTGAPQEKAQVL